MNIPPETIKAWLKTNNKDRAWLATQCGVSIHTVNGWFAKGANRDIPKPSQTVIAALMHSEPVTPRFSLDQYERIQKKAADAGMSVSEWVEAAIKAALLLTVLSTLAFHFQKEGTDFSLAACANTGKAICAFASSQLE